MTEVEQTFRNHTDRELEATYVFPVPAGSSIREFSLWVNGQKVKGELLRADKAKQIYTSIVRQTKNPALLDYIGTEMLSMKIFPIPAKGDQKVSLSFTSIAPKQHQLVKYTYPLKTDRNATSTLEELKLTVAIKSQQPLGSIYSPSHEIVSKRINEHEAIIEFERHAALLDRDFELFYSTSGQDIGLTTIAHRPVTDDDGYVMMLVSPRANLAEDQKVPRDIVFVIDTSGSMMHDKKIEQAKNSLKYCLGNLNKDDRFALISFATTVDTYRDELVAAEGTHLQRAKGWVSDLYAGGGTAVHRALTKALSLRSDDPSRMFTVVFFTDGQPTIGETNVEKILADVDSQNTANTRIFSFGLGNDLNAAFLDKLAEQSRALSSYVRPEQSIESKVSTFFDKIHHPVLANLTLTSTADVHLMEVYPPELPDLFHGDQLVVLARYQGAGHAAIVLDGKVGIHEKKFVYELDFAEETDDKPFVEELWARRKVGYLLDQIRQNGEQSELVDEIVRLSTSYGITTPYTSYLIMPDAPVELASVGGGAGARVARGPAAPAALDPTAFGGKADDRDGAPAKVVEFARQVQSAPGDFSKNRGRFQDKALDLYEEKLAANESSGLATRAQRETLRRVTRAKSEKSTLDRVHYNYSTGQWRQNQVRKLGVDLALCMNKLKCESQLPTTAVRRVASRNCVEIGGVWIDDAFNAATKTVTVKAQSDAYFRILECQPQMKDVFRLGNHLVYITPNGTGLVIDTSDGQEQMSEKEINSLFVSK